MEQIKIDNFNKATPEFNFPSYTTLAKKDCEKIRFTLSQKLGIEYPCDDLALVYEVDKLSVLYEEKRCDDESFNLNNLLFLLKIQAPEYVCINWHRFDVIDKVKFDDLSTHFDDIWYPSVDDINIFNEPLTWLLSVTHYGRVKVLRL
ncbi:MAG: hypothetical protein WAW36_11750 [Methylovulum miyakonense]|uniref:hypothetical protein n=1 Tax=Methylovulum miyakonense TaxID=645578 RepID=UPI003BB6F0F7